MQPVVMAPKNLRVKNMRNAIDGFLVAQQQPNAGVERGTPVDFYFFAFLVHANSKFDALTHVE